METRTSLEIQGEIVVRSGERPLGSETPLSLFKEMGDGQGAFLLETSPTGGGAGRFSFFGRDPLVSLRSRGSTVEVEGEMGSFETHQAVTSVLRHLISQLVPTGLPDGPFAGGFIGFLGYDVARTFEFLPDKPEVDRDLPDAEFFLPGLLFRYDHASHTLRATVLTPIRSDRAEAERVADEMLTQALAIRGLPEDPASGQFPAGPLAEEPFTPGRDRYVEMVLEAKEAIAAGEIFQIVLSTRAEVETGAPPVDLYSALSRLNPSPYLFYLNFGAFHLIGSSPEVLVTVRQGRVTLRPIAGTRRRGASPEEDAVLIQNLASDEKERAEHTMLLDLGRNDVGRVSRPGTVEVTSLMEVERYSHVLHLVSQVEGDLMPGTDALSALEASFPAGTLTGAPKIRAMELIDRWEPVARGPYGGAVGYVGLDGSLDTCIAIRTFVLMGDRAYVQAGAGIVADSNPQKEWEECQGKAAALLAVLQGKGARP